MAYQRVAQSAPSSAGAVRTSGDDTATTSPRSANFVGLHQSTYKARPSDLSAGQRGDGVGSTNSGQDVSRRGPPSSMRHRRSGYRDPSYAHAPSANGVNGTSKPKRGNEKELPIPVAVLLWYLLGVLSIASSKVLLSSHGVPPSLLTLQQLIIGMTLLRILLEMQTSAETDKDGPLRRGLQPIPIQHDSDGVESSSDACEAGTYKRKSSNGVVDVDARSNSSKHGVISALLGLVRPSGHGRIHNHLFLAAIYFAMGFLLTNCGFQSGSAAFVETVKAAEPFTSASAAVLWGIERLGKEEVASLTGIVAGVVLSTMGHRGSAKPAGDALDVPSQSIATQCIVVMLANLCFSLRGLHQKLFRSTPQGKASVVDDLNLQYRMQQIGVLMLIIPALLGNATGILSKVQHAFVTGSMAKYALRYTLLSLVNGLAFTSYNLASTYVLTRISVVHHAALNCIRRVFAIIVTSLIFGLKFTSLQVVGMALAANFFFAYSHFKMKKETKTKRRKELRKKWSSIMMDAKGTKVLKKKSSSILPMNHAVD